MQGQTQRSLASSPRRKKHLMSELQQFPPAVLHHVQRPGGAISITIVLCPLFSSAALLKTPDVPLSAPPQPRLCLTEQYFELTSPLRATALTLSFPGVSVSSAGAFLLLASFQTLIKRIQKAALSHSQLEILTDRLCLTVAKSPRNHRAGLGLC